MGLPCSKNSKPKRLKNYSSKPSLCLGYDDTLKFKVEIGNIKARNLPPNSSYIQISFAEQKEFTTAKIENNSQNLKNYSWRMHEEFEYTCNNKALKHDEITLTLIDKSEKEIGVVSIGMYDLATGPSHQDFVIKMKKKREEPGRLSFDVKMSQLLNVEIRSQSITCKMSTNLREKFYNFSLKMTTKDREFFSAHSFNFKNLQMFVSLVERNNPDELGDENYQLYMDENKKVKMKYFAGTKINRNFRKMQNSARDDVDAETLETSKFDDDSFPTCRIKEKKSFLTKALSMAEKKSSAPGATPMNKKDIIWNYEPGNEIAPVLQMNINVRDLATGTFQFFLWANKEGKEGLNRSVSEDESMEYSSDEVYIDHKLVGECFIGMSKFFSDDTENTEASSTKETSSQEGGSPYQRRIIKLTEKLLFHGEPVGEFMGEFCIENSPFFKQMIFGVRTEEGIQRSSALYLKSDRAFPAAYKNTNVKEIKTLGQLKENLKTSAFSLFGQKPNPRVRIRLIDDLATNMLKVLEILKTSHQESLISILYKTPENLLASQKILIGLAKHSLDNCDEVPNSLRPVYFETLVLLIHRAEFELNYMGFDVSNEEFLKNAKTTSFKNDTGGPKIDLKNIQQKLKVCESYQALLYHTLQKVLNKLTQKGLPDKEREFVEQFTAIAYFRIPEFRNRLLECLKKDIQQVQIPEWRGMEWRLDDHLDDNKTQHLFTLFDWERVFYVYLKNTEKGESNYKLLGEILEDRDWQNRYAKRGIAYYLFLNEWAKHVNKSVVTKDHVPWQDLPGYAVLIKAFLIELKSKDVRRYPAPLLNASYALLKNEKLLNVFIAIVYNKTRLYESSNVFAVFELINNWLGVLKENKKSIGTNFDYAYFFKGLIMVIEGDHALNIAKALWVIYNNFNLFPYNQKQQLSEYFFGSIFFKLFLHWSWIVRQVFHHLLIYRFYHQHRKTSTHLTNIDDLKKELLLYNQKRENYYKHKKLLINDFINMEYSRNMTIIENAYKKFKQEKMQRNQTASKTIYDQKKRPSKDTRRVSLLPEISEFNKPILPPPDFDSGKKEEYFPKLRLKVSSSEKNDVDHIVDDFFEPQDQPIRKQSTGGDSTIWYINPDNLEISIQGPVNRISRSESVNLTPKNELDMDLNKPEELNTLNIQARKKYSEGPESIRSHSIRQSLPGIPDEDRKTKEKRKVIVRRLMYFDKQTNQLKEIPKEYAVYLEYAYKEYEAIKQQYVNWANELQLTLAKLPDEQAKKMKADPKVPEISVKIPLDDGEDGQIDNEEW